MYGFRAGMGAVAGLMVAISAGGAVAQQRVVAEIPYVTCDGSQWRASLSGEQFHHRPANGDAGHSDRIIRYRTWGGGCWQATWNSSSRTFFHTPASGAEGHPDTILNFEDWDGARWTARRDGSDWVVTPG
ncbi:hypothetical protein ACETK8_05110 [Brevundimonas staleyi]|uniref:Secreted protein n=1 Tax=Brevundimonas staleyi TaxID=74326 RepID=A0ABW0FX00_9CAUL